MFRFFKIVDEKLKYKSFIIIFIFFLTIFLEILAIGSTVPLILSIGDFNNVNFKKFQFIQEFITSESSVIIILSILASFIFVKNIILIILERYKNKFRRDLIKNISSRLLNKYLEQDLIFHIKKNSSFLIKNIREDTQFVVSTFISLLKVFSDIFIFIFFSLILIYSNFFLSISMISVLMIFFLTFNLFTKKELKNWGKDKFKISSITNKYLTESILNFKEIKIYNIKNYFLYRFNKSVASLYNIQNKFDNFQAYPRLILEIIILLIVLIFLVILFNQNVQKDIIFLQISFFLIVGVRLSPIAVQIYKFFQSLKYTSNTLDKMIKDLSLKEKYKSIKNFEFSFKNKVSINKINFSHDNRKNIIKDLNLDIYPNDFIGIYGESGIGKTTFLEILLGFLKIKSGSIKSDNENIELSFNSWINMLGYIPQNSIFVDETIIRNISFKDTNDRTEVKKISKLLNLVNLNFSDKKIQNFKIGENAKKLSAGQKQRLAIARALYKDPKILLLDEITSSLDLKNEEKILRLLKKLKKNKTIIFISHKKNSLKFCNKVYKFKNGKLIRSKYK